MKDPGGITFIKVSFSPKWVILTLQKYANNKLKLLSYFQCISMDVLKLNSSFIKGLLRKNQTFSALYALTWFLF